MKDKKLKPIANAVRADFISAHKGITLIALVITIIVMLILVAVTVTVAIKGGLFTTAKQATTDTQYQADREMLLSAVIGAINNNAEVDFDNLNNNLPDGFTVSEGLYTSKARNKFCVNQSGNILTPPEVTVDGKTVALTPNNVGEYLGKVVTNYKGQSSVNDYTVSTTYRLYYVDFDNKYKDGEGTVYLKADCTSDNNYPLQTTTPSDTDVVKIKNLNPELYKNGNPPNSENDNIQEVTWLTNTNNWNNLKPETFFDGITEQDINYIVGAPSLEMMMDSYNTHYKKDIENFSDAPDISTIPEGERRKLFYQYNSGDSGYKVGPCANANSEYYTSTSPNSVYTDAEIDSMYYPGYGQYYWLASPSSDNANFTLSVLFFDGGYVGTRYWGHSFDEQAFCPLVSLKSSVNLKLQ